MAKELGLVRRPIRVGPPPRPPRRRRRRRPTTTYQNGFEAAGARAGAIFGAIGGNAGLGAGIVAGAGLLGGLLVDQSRWSQEIAFQQGYAARDAAGHRRPRHGERRTNYRAVIAQMGCRSSIARHPSFHLPDTQIQRRPFHRYSDHASNESGANGSAAASTNGTPLPVTTAAALCELGATAPSATRRPECAR